MVFAGVDMFVFLFLFFSNKWKTIGDIPQKLVDGLNIEYQNMQIAHTFIKECQPYVDALNSMNKLALSKSKAGKVVARTRKELYDYLMRAQRSIQDATSAFGGTGFTKQFCTPAGTIKKPDLKRLQAAGKRRTTKDVRARHNPKTKQKTTPQKSNR